MPAKSNTHLAKSVCRMCMSCCGVDAHVEDGRLVKVSAMKEHPVHRLCVKATAIPDWIYSSRRAIHPLKKVNGEWQEISWDDALGIIAEKLSDIKAEYGAKSLVVHLGEPLVEINPADAAKLGIADGEMVIVESAKGSITLKAMITPDILPRVLSLQHGWKEANANLLTDNKPGDPILGYPAFKTTPCRVKRAG